MRHSSYVVMSSTGRHEFITKDQALVFIGRLRDFEESYRLIEVINQDRLLVQGHNDLIPKIMPNNGNVWDKIMTSVLLEISL